MGLKQQRSEIKGKFPESIRVRANEKRDVLIDCEKDAKKRAFHPEIKFASNCTGDGCKWCAAKLVPKIDWIVDCWQKNNAGQWSPASLWLSEVDFGKFVDVLPENAKTAVVSVIGEPVFGDNGEPKMSPKGNLWTDLRFEVVKFDGLPARPTVSVDGEIL